MKTLLIVASFLVFAAGSVRNSLPPWVAFAKNDNAPGQAVKAEKQAQNTTGKDTSPGQLKKQGSPTLAATVSASPKVKAFLQNKPSQTALKKIGSAKLREYLALEGTGSALPRQLKLVKAKVREATPGAQMKRHAVQGIITAVAGGSVVISHQIQSGRSWTVYYNAATVVKMKGNDAATGADLAIGMRIAAVGEPSDEGGLLAKRIHVIPGRATGVFDKQPEASDGGDLDMSPTPVATATATPGVTQTPEPTAVVSPTAEPEPSPTEVPATPTP